MFRAGLLEEVKTLVEKYGLLGRTASQAVGYKESIEFLNGHITESMLKEQVKAHTRQFVRRQEIWFRSMPLLRRLAATNTTSISEHADQIQSLISA
jgi:tRNA dimethylallyltransferase